MIVLAAVAIGLVVVAVLVLVAALARVSRRADDAGEALGACQRDEAWESVGEGNGRCRDFGAS